MTFNMTSIGNTSNNIYKQIQFITSKPQQKSVKAKNKRFIIKIQPSFSSSSTSGNKNVTGSKTF